LQSQGHEFRFTGMGRNCRKSKTGGWFLALEVTRFWLLDQQARRPGFRIRKLGANTSTKLNLPPSETGKSEAEKRSAVAVPFLPRGAAFVTAQRCNCYLLLRRWRKPSCLLPQQPNLGAQTWKL
jgi:hypothetical protein